MENNKNNLTLEEIQFYFKKKFKHWVKPNSVETAKKAFERKLTKALGRDLNDGGVRASEKQDTQQVKQENEAAPEVNDGTRD